MLVKLIDELTGDEIEVNLLTVKQASEILGMSEGTIRNRLSQGLSMPARFKVGGKVLFLMEDILYWLKEQKETDQVSALDNLIAGPWRKKK